MTIDKQDASAALDDIAVVVQRVKQSRVYRTSSTILMLWGVIVFAAYLAAFAFPAYARTIWLVTQSVATVATLVLSVGWGKGERTSRVEWRVGALFVLIVGFGILWSSVLGRMGPRELNVFWPTLFMFCYTIAGLWFGRLFLVAGLAITTLAVAGYHWAGPLIEPYMAVINGGGLVLCGLIMRRA